MSYSKVKTFNAGKSRTGLATVGYTLTGGARTTAGVTEEVAGSGIYKATVAFADAFGGQLTWDTGEGANTRYAVEEINPGDDENGDAKVSSRLPTASYAAPPSDYQQRGVAVTLPANPPGGFLVTASYGTAPAWYTAGGGGGGGTNWTDVADGLYTYQQLFVKMGDVLMGNRGEAADHTATTIYKFTDPNVTSITSTQTATSRQVTLH